MDPVSNEFLSRFGLKQPQTSHSNELGQGEFLELMTAQIQHQNPLEPMQNGEFIAQMASFSSVEALDKMKDSIETLVASLTGNQVLRAATLVGHQVMVAGDTVEHTDTGGTRFSVLADNAGQPITVNVFNSSDQLVRRFDARANHRGSNAVEWDGKDLQGNPVPVGVYRIEAQSTSNGVSTTLPTAIPKEIRSVAPGSNGAEVALRLASGESIGLADVVEIL